jgi:hypothetical protein
MVMLGSTPIGGPILGAVCDAFGARAGLVIGGLAAVTAAAWGRQMIKRGMVDAASAPMPSGLPRPTAVPVHASAA